jgi:hypothetical protein
MINVNKILELSATGFRLESGWKTCDKFHVRSKPLFKDLKVGDEIDNLTYHLDKSRKNEYVMGFIVLNHKDQEEEIAKSSRTNVTSHNINSVKLNSPPVSSLPIVRGSDLEREGIALPPKVCNSVPSVQDKKRDGQLYGLCLKLAFNNISARGLNLEVKVIRDKGYVLADEMYYEKGGI